MEQENSLDEIENEIIKLKMKKKKIKEIQDRRLRLRSNNCGKSNDNIRVSLSFKKKIPFINNKRDENGRDFLSGPKITDLIIRHKKWKFIENDIIGYNTNLDSNGEDFNDK